MLLLAFEKKSQDSACISQVNPELKSAFEEKGMKFVGQDVEGERMEVVELEGEHLDQWLEDWGWYQGDT